MLRVAFGFLIQKSKKTVESPQGFLEKLPKRGPLSKQTFLWSCAPQESLITLGRALEICSSSNNPSDFPLFVPHCYCRSFSYFFTIHCEGPLTEKCSKVCNFKSQTDNAAFQRRALRTFLWDSFYTLSLGLSQPYPHFSILCLIGDFLSKLVDIMFKQEL